MLNRSLGGSAAVSLFGNDSKSGSGSADLIFSCPKADPVTVASRCLARMRKYAKVCCWSFWYAVSPFSPSPASWPSVLLRMLEKCPMLSHIQFTDDHICAATSPFGCCTNCTCPLILPGKVPRKSGDGSACLKTSKVSFSSNAASTVFCLSMTGLSVYALPSPTALMPRAPRLVHTWKPESSCESASSSAPPTFAVFWVMVVCESLDSEREREWSREGAGYLLTRTSTAPSLSWARCAARSWVSRGFPDDLATPRGRRASTGGGWCRAASACWMRSCCRRSLPCARAAVLTVESTMSVADDAMTDVGVSEAAPRSDEECWVVCEEVRGRSIVTVGVPSGSLLGGTFLAATMPRFAGIWSTGLLWWRLLTWSSSLAECVARELHVVR